MENNLMVQNRSLTGEFQESRELSEIKGKMFLARQFPRDEGWALEKVLKECERPELAAIAQYEYPKGETVVRGASIRLVEVLARNWANLEFGVNEIETSGEETLIKAYAWDLETNVSDAKTFSVKHERSTRKGSYKLTDERDIYEMVANKGSRRKRACLLSVLPGWYVDAALAKCEDTLKKVLTGGKSMEEVIESIVTAFAEFGITPFQISEKMSKDIDKLSQNDIIKLRHLYSAIKDGFVRAQDAFSDGVQTATEELSDEELTALDELNKKLQCSGGTGDGTDEG
ncbi:MAG: hypothetical protein RR365_11265 [Bacteroides sp.]